MWIEKCVSFAVKRVDYFFACLQKMDLLLFLPKKKNSVAQMSHRMSCGKMKRQLSDTCGQIEYSLVPYLP